MLECGYQFAFKMSLTGAAVGVCLQAIVTYGIASQQATKRPSCGAS